MGGVSGLSRVADYLEGHPDEAVLLISCELGGTAFWQGGVQGYLNEVANAETRGPTFYSDLISQIVSVALFGDGAGAVVLSGALPGEQAVIGAFDLGSDGERADLLAIPAGGSRQRSAHGRTGTASARPRDHRSDLQES